MQPYFFPHLGYFELICRTDRWVVFDTPQYTRKSWMNRNRILHQKQGWQYINLPVQHAPLETPVKDILVTDPEAARARLQGQLTHYRRHAPYYREVKQLVDDGFTRAAGPGLAHLNVATLAAVCDYLELPFHWQMASALELDLPPVEHPGQWALHIATQLRADEYLNPPGGKQLFRREEWQAAGIGLRFTRPLDFAYPCPPHAFEPRLSILDVLMWCDPAQVRAAIADNPFDE
jgi:hypothetical protein